MNAALCASIPGWFPPPHGLAGVRAAYGDIMVVGDRVCAPNGWESQNMAKVYDLPLVTRPLYCNKLIVPALRAALSACSEIGGYELKTIGCFSPRIKRSSDTLSVHSWGAAIDINADDNPPLRIRTADDIAKKQKTIPDEWIAAFKLVGWTWGGDFSSYYDPMHFQFCSGY